MTDTCRQFSDAEANAIVRRFLDAEPYPKNERFMGALKALERLAYSGDSWAASAIAGAHGLSGPLTEPEKSYKWYFVHFALEGYSTEYRQTQEGPSYCGPVGDFRNEAYVSELLDEFGLQRVDVLDKEAQEMLNKVRNNARKG